MARTFIGTPFVAYRGTSMTVQDTTFCTPSKLPSRIIALFGGTGASGAGINWGSFGFLPDVGIDVTIPLEMADKLGKIGSLYIDNTGSTIPIYVTFPDTGFTITAPPFTSVWYPVFTNKFNFQIVALGMVAGFTPRTKIFISNREVAASVDTEIQKNFPQWVGTTTAQFGAANSITPGFGPPALGDRTAIQQSAFTTTTGPSGFTITDLSNLTGFIYITSMDVSFDVFGGVVSAAGNTLSMAFNFGDNLGNFMLRGAVSARDATATPQSLNVNAIRLQGLNLRYIATGNLFVIATDAPVVSAGTITSVRWRATVNIVYSNNPQ